MVRKKYINSFIFSSLFTFFIFSAEASVEEVNEEALTRNQSLDFIWYKKLPENYLRNDQERHEKAIISAITVIEQRLTVHTHYEVDVNYNDYDYKFLKYSNYLIWGFMKYFDVFSLNHPSYNGYAWRLSTVLWDQAEYFERFSNILARLQDSKYKTGIARGYLELAKLYDVHKQVYLSSAWTYFSNIQGKISKKNKYWQAEVLYNGYIPQGMTELEALNLAIEFCEQVQEKKRSAREKYSPKGGNKAEGIMPHHNYLIHKNNREKNMTLLNLLEEKRRNLNNVQNDEDNNNISSNDGSEDSSSDDNDGPSEGEINRFANLNNEDNGQQSENFDENEYNEMLAFHDDENLEELDANHEPVSNFTTTEWNQHIDDDDEMVFINTTKNNKSFVLEDEEENINNHINDNIIENNINEIREIVNITNFQILDNFYKNGGTKRTVNSVYWQSQQDNICKMLNAFQNKKVVYIKGKGNFSVKTGGVGDQNYYRMIADIYGVKAKNLYNTLEVLGIRERKARTDWEDENTINKLRKEVLKGSTLEDLEKIFESDSRTIKRVCKDNKIDLFGNKMKERKKRIRFDWTKQNKETAKRMFSEGKTYKEIAEKFGINRKMVTHELNGEKKSRVFTYR